ncbi:hypothetical protein DSO57_1036344 [Entomophthora muscae]|uniref:Uncharacterized protein n=1 Tax=Entomophthora muscae TaxID=34485 RepID=A0ACC2SZ93_9FUNG|nr:hypothetical protein DSO57_1036344 [Entomophthora muscae]
MLPWFILKESFENLDEFSLAELRLACRSFNQIIQPIFFRAHPPEKVNSGEVRHLYIGKRKLLRILKIKSTDLRYLQKSHISISQIFPNLVSLILILESVIKEESIRYLVKELYNYRNLKYLSIRDYHEINLLLQLKPFIQKLDFLYVDNPYEIIVNSKEFEGLKVLMFDYSCINQKGITAQALNIFREVVLVNRNVPFLSSRTDSILYSNWISYDSNNTEYLAKFPIGYLQSEEALGKCYQMEQFPAGLYATDSQLDFFALLATPNVVEHCIVTRNFAEDGESKVPPPGIFNIPSLDLTIHESGLFRPGRDQFQATKLSLNLVRGWSSTYFQSIVDCFPNLQHLYVTEMSPSHFVPFNNLSIPNLLHFYFRGKNALVCNEIAKAAPNLVCIHTNSINTRFLENRTPPLKIAPYQNITGFGGEIGEIAGYDKYL